MIRVFNPIDSTYLKCFRYINLVCYFLEELKGGIFSTDLFELHCFSTDMLKKKDENCGGRLTL